MTSNKRGKPEIKSDLEEQTNPEMRIEEASQTLSTTRTKDKSSELTTFSIAKGKRI